MNIFDTEQEAQDALRELNEDFAKKMCPVFKTTCRLEGCHSFFESRCTEVHYSDKSIRYRVIERQCTCSTVTGVVVMEAE